MLKVSSITRQNENWTIWLKFNVQCNADYCTSEHKNKLFHYGKPRKAQSTVMKENWHTWTEQSRKERKIH